MDTDFMPMLLDSISQQSKSTYATANTRGRTDENGVTIKTEDDQFGLNFEDFLQLMVQQLQNQTMDNTADTGEMLNQMVQMSTVQMLSSVQDSMEALVNANTLNYAASLVGKTVTVGKLDDEGNLEEVVGTVTGTGTYQGTFVIFVNDEMYALNDIMAVGTLPEIPEESGEGGEGGEGEGNGEGDGDSQTGTQGIV